MAAYNVTPLVKLVEQFERLPGIGHKTAQRLAYHVLQMPKDKAATFAQTILDAHDKIKYCSICKNFTDDEVCSICSDNSREHNTICVVESVRDVMSIENTGQYHGVYHVLGGIISPINGIGPSDLTIRELVQRVESFSDSGADAVQPEVILALSGDVEGETTSFYIYRQLSRFNVRITSLARGLGFGDDLEYADELTLGRSIVNRQIFRP